MPNKPHSGFFFELILWISGIVSEIFFREVSVRGSFNLPKQGASIVVIAPHANQFLDAALVILNVYKLTGRQTHFIEAAVSFRRKVVGALSTMSGAIPVERAQDILISKEGEITYEDYDSDEYVIKGTNTHFTRDCSVKGLIGLPHSAGNAPIAEIISDTKLRLAKPFKTEKGIQMIKDGTTFKAAPKVDNSEAFKEVFKHLHAQGLIGISPEGGSHDRTELLPLKPGVAIMALGAVAEDPSCKVNIIPCGMNYFHPHKFRSRAVLEFGTPIVIDSSMGERYKENSREVVGELMTTITEAMKAVTVQSPDYETLMTIQAARRLYNNSNKGHKQTPLSLVVEMNRNLLLGYTKYKDEPQIQHLKDSVAKYNKKLRYLGIRDHQVESATTNRFYAFSVFITRFFKLLIITFLSLPGTILFGPVFIATKIISTKKQKQALAASTVKVRAIDVIGSWKVLVALVVAPTLYFVYSLIGTIIVFRFGLIPRYFCWFNKAAFIFPLCWSVLVATTWAAFKMGEVGMDIFKSLKPLLLILTTNSSELQKLKEEREGLAKEITDVINKLGPSIVKNYKPRYQLEDDDSDYEEIELEEAESSDEAKSSILERTKSSDSLWSGYSEVHEKGNRMPNLASIDIFSDPVASSSSESSSRRESVIPGSGTTGSKMERFDSAINLRVREALKKRESESQED